MEGELINVGQRINLSIRQESNPWPPEHRAGALSTELLELMESKVIRLSSYNRGALRTARISTVEATVNSNKCHGACTFRPFDFYLMMKIEN